MPQASGPHAPSSSQDRHGTPAGLFLLILDAGLGPGQQGRGAPHRAVRASLGGGRLFTGHTMRPWHLGPSEGPVPLQSQIRPQVLRCPPVGGAGPPRLPGAVQGSALIPQSCLPSEQLPEAGRAARAPAADEVEGGGGKRLWLPGAGEARGRYGAPAGPAAGTPLWAQLLQPSTRVSTGRKDSVDRSGR